MTFKASIHYGDTILDLMAGGYVVKDGYFPEAADDDAPITEQMDVLIRGSSQSDLQTKIQAIELALAHGQRNPTGPDACYLYFSIDQSLDEYRSRITNGVVMLDAKLDHRWRELKAVVRVVIERMPWWETVEPVTLDTSNSGGTSGAIVNHQDATTGHDFYLEIADTAVPGGLPTPAIIEFKNTVDDARTVDNIYIGQFVESKPASLPTETTLVLEGSGSADAACSGGAYATLSWTGATENQLATWSLATTFMGQRYYKLIARFRDTFAYTDLWLQARLLSGSLVLAQTRWEMMSASRALQLIGTLQIPPFRHGAYIDLGNLTVALYEKRAGGDGTVNLDYIALLPQNGWRHYGAISGLAHDKILIDNPVDDYLVTNYITSYEVTHMVEGGLPIMLKPGVKNILYFLHDTDTGTAPIARTATVTIKCHPRKRTI